MSADLLSGRRRRINTHPINKQASKPTPQTAPTTIPTRAPVPRELELLLGEELGGLPRLGLPVAGATMGAAMGTVPGAGGGGLTPAGGIVALSWASGRTGLVCEPQSCLAGEASGRLARRCARLGVFWGEIG